MKGKIKIIDFMIAALPFLIIGICIAIMVVKCTSVKSKEEKKDLAMRMSLGMCIGMCGGVAASSAFHFNLALGISLGMLVGETVGVFIKKLK